MIDPFPNDEAFTAVMRSMVTEINGSIYPGYRLEAAIDTIKWLRTHPETHAVLLGILAEAR